MRWLLLTFVVAVACGSSYRSARWKPYTGCNAAQCDTWYEECTADCINERKASVTECRTKCGNRKDSCLAACPG